MFGGPRLCVPLFPFFVSLYPKLRRDDAQHTQAAYPFQSSRGYLLRPANPQMMSVEASLFSECRVFGVYDVKFRRISTQDEDFHPH